MSSTRVRLSLDSRLWQAVTAVAGARDMDPADVVTEALQVYFGPASVIETAAELTREHMGKVFEISDQLRLISDYIVDRNHPEQENELIANANGTEG